MGAAPGSHAADQQARETLGGQFIVRPTIVVVHQILTAAATLQHASNKFRSYGFDVFRRKLRDRQPPVTQHHMSQLVSNGAVSADNAMTDLHYVAVRKGDPLTKYPGRKRCILDLHDPAVRMRPTPCDLDHRSLPTATRGKHLVHRSNDRAMTAGTASRKPHGQ